MNRRLYIKTTSQGHRILVIEGTFDIDKIETLKNEDFDLIYLKDSGQTSYELSYQLQNMSPFNSSKCHLKPCFLASSLENRIRNSINVIDGYADSEDDKSMLKRSDEIYEKLAHIETFDITEVRRSNYMNFLKLCKYAISRDMLTFTHFVDEAYAKGHAALFTAQKDNQTEKLKEEFSHFNQILVDLGYAQRTSFIDRIHVCPKCKGTHLFYMEACPKCDSSNLNEEPVLHHFRCANISPESSYAYDGELRCPKCNQFLRHIGVDYDRPSNVYTCRTCNHNFLHTKMKVYCSSCKSVLRPYELLPIDLYNYEYTPEGLMALSSNNALIAISKDIWAGYSNYESFISQIRLFLFSHQEDKVIYINRFKVEGSHINQEIIMDIVNDIQKRYHYNNISYKGNYIYMAIYMAVKGLEKMSDSIMHELEEEYSETTKIVNLKHPGVTLTEQEYLYQYDGEKIEAFIKRISK